MQSLKSLNLQKWIKENREKLVPPVANKQLFYNDDMIIMAVAGPNSRTDFHINPTPEFFHQIEGSIYLDLKIDDKIETVELGAGDMLLVEANIPHRPRRPKNTLGLVVEFQQKNGKEDSLVWYCENCGKELYKDSFVLQSIEKDLVPVITHYNQNKEKYACQDCD